MTQSESQAAYGKGRTTKDRAERKGNTAALGRLAHAFEEHGIDLSDLGNVKSVWMKSEVNSEGEDVVSGASVLLAPSWETGPEWPVIQPAEPVTVKVPKARPSKPSGSWKTAVILPDPQIGYRRLTDGTLDPFQDERALDVALQITESERPDLIVNLGDFLDFPSFGRYRQEPGFAMTTQATIDRGHDFLARQVALSPDVRLLEGNHDARLHNAIMDNAAAAFGIRRANAPAEWPAMSVPNLLRLDDLGVEYIGGYPVGATYITHRLACIHGRKVKSNGSTAAAVVKDEHVSVIFGHVHRIETQFRTFNRKGTPRTIVAHTPGTLARIDGAVPGAAAGLDPHGRPVRHFQNWQQGLTVARFNTETGAFALEPVHIFEGWAMHRGQEFRATTEGP